VSASITEAGTRVIKRPDVATGLGGAAIPLQSDRYFDVKITAQLSSPDTVGDSSTWNLLPLFKACPVSITDVSTTSTTIKPAFGSLPMTDWTPITFAGQTKNGLRRQASDVMLALTDIKADAGGVITLEFAGVGKWQADAASTLSAPDPAYTKLPVVVMNGTCSDSVGSEMDFGYSLKTGMKVTPLQASASGSNGWGTPVGTRDEAELSYDVLAATGYETARAAGAALTVSFAYGTAELESSTAYVNTVDAADQGGVQAYTVSLALSPAPSTPEWSIVLT
jgi:hypothetical protein